VLLGFALTAGLAGTAAADAPSCGSVTYDGDGITGNPFQVDDVDKLQCVGSEHDDVGSQSEALSSNYTLVSDIDASGTSSWNGGAGFDPVGDSSNEFTGTFDGNGYTIAGLVINRSSTTHVGMFGNTDDSATLERVELADATVDGNRSVGVLVGENNGTVRNSSASGTVNGPNGEVGGLVGNNYGDVIESSASVRVNGSSALGGLVGNSRIGSTVTESYATGDIETPTASSVGGLVGLSNSATVNRSYATGNVTADVSVGGVVGDSRTGGVGDPDSVITRTYATGNVTGNTNVGGIVGVGQGGFGGPDLEITDSYWDNESTGQTDAVGFGFGATEENNSGLTTAEMTGADAPTNMTSFDFNPTWVTTDSYPELFWSVERLELDAPATLNVGETAPAPSVFSIVDGRTPSVTGVANYSSSDTAVVTVSSPLTAVGSGTSTVTAEHFGFTDSEELEVSGEGGGSGCLDRRDLGRGQEDEECPKDRVIERGGSREELDRETGRRSGTSRRDRGRGSRGRDR